MRVNAIDPINTVTLNQLTVSLYSKGIEADSMLQVGKAVQQDGNEDASGGSKSLTILNQKMDYYK